MIKVKIEFDYLSSLLSSYHILCAPTEMNKKYNQEIFKTFSVSIEEQERYLTFLQSLKVNLDDTDSVRWRLFFEGNKTLDELLNKNQKIIVSDKVQNNIKAFEKQFNPYFDTIKKSVEPFVPQKIKEIESSIENIYDTAYKFTGICIPRPWELIYRIVEGAEPQAKGSDITDGKGYVFAPPSDVVSHKITTLIHECVGHQTVDHLRKNMEEIFGSHIYEYEEGFVKLFSREIAKVILKQYVNYGPSGELETLSFRTFEKNLYPQKGKFNEWYISCLKEINAEYKK